MGYWPGPALPQWPLTVSASDNHPNIHSRYECCHGLGPASPPRGSHNGAGGRAGTLDPGLGSGGWEGPNLQQLHLHAVTHKVGVLAALPALQVVSGYGEGHGRGIQGALQPLLLGQQQVSLCDQLFHLALQLQLPAVHVLQALAHLLRGVLLRALRQRLSLGYQLPALVVLLLRLVEVGKGLVVAGIAVLEPLIHQVFGRAEASGGQARGHVGACVSGHIVQLAGHLACWHRLRGGLLGQKYICLRHGVPGHGVGG
uniref:Uncharacterized protein n=1 Tax=Monodon monoceros TaxID=40151 RepID=A0A8C6AQ45_MONMO